MSADTARKLLVFQLGSERFAIPLSSIEEVVDAPAIQAIPDAPPGVLGITRVRETFVPIYDPAVALHVDRSRGAGGRTGGAALLFMHDGKRIALFVDDVYDAVSIVDGELRPPPAIGVNDSVVTSILRRTNELIAVVDLSSMLAAATTTDQEVGE